MPPRGPDGTVDHVAFAVRSIRDTLDIFGVLFDYRLVYGTDDDERRIRTMQISADGRAKLELMEPLSGESPLDDHIERRGEGFHHMTVTVGDVHRVIADFAHLGVQTIGTDARDPAWMETYTRPRTCIGTMIQIAQTDRNWFSPFPEVTVEDVLAGRLVWTGSSIVWRDGHRPDEAWPPRRDAASPNAPGPSA